MHRLFVPSHVLIVLAMAWCIIMPLGLICESSAADDDYPDPAGYSYADYTTPEFNVAVTVDKAHVMHVSETITCDFTGSLHHGIYRYIPVQTKYYTIRHLQVADWNYETSIESGTSDGQPYKYEIVRIGDPDSYITGIATFVITYDLVCYKDDAGDADYLSIDLLPTSWETPIGSSTLTLTMPKDMDWSSVRLYSGAYGSSGGLSSSFKSSTNEYTNTLTITGRDITDYTGVTVSATLPEGYWEDPADRSVYRHILYVLLVLIPLIAAALWFLFGRDPKIIRTVEFYPPEGMSPAEIGYLIDGSVETADITSLIMYFAHKGYTKIHEVSKGSFEILRQCDPDESEKPFVRSFCRSLFKHGEIANLDDMPSSFGEDILKTRDSITKYYNDKKRRIFTDASKTCRGIGLVLMLIPGLVSVYMACREMATDGAMFYMALVLVVQAIGMLIMIGNFDRKDARLFRQNLPRFIFGIALTGAGAAVPAVITWMITGRGVLGACVALSILVTFFFVVLMKARTKDNARLQGQILGFRDFIRTAEYDRLKALSDEDPEYYFNVLPYAYVMGMATKWSKKFQDININRPAWYSSYDNNHMFNTMMYSHMMSNWGSSISSQWTDAIAAKVSDTASDFGGGGGFSGGGFSGGGFGGGGGGAW